MDASESQIEVVPYDEYIRLQTEIILSRENINKAEDFYGHKPSRNEAACYYILSGQAREFSKKYQILEKPSEKN